MGRRSNRTCLHTASHGPEAVCTASAASAAALKTLSKPLVVYCEYRVGSCQNWGRARETARNSARWRQCSWNHCFSYVSLQEKSNARFFMATLGRRCSRRTYAPSDASRPLPVRTSLTSTPEMPSIASLPLARSAAASCRRSAEFPLETSGSSEALAPAPALLMPAARSPGKPPAAAEGRRRKERGALGRAVHAAGAHARVAAITFGCVRANRQPRARRKSGRRVTSTSPHEDSRSPVGHLVRQRRGGGCEQARSVEACGTTITQFHAAT